MVRIRDIVNFFEEWAPAHTAEEWDSVGLHIGDPEWEVSSVLLALDPTGDALQKAVETRSGLLFTHHPLFFKPIKNLVFGNPATTLVETALRHQVAVYCAHTNLDAAMGGVNDVLASLLDIRVEGDLSESPPDRMCKVVVFVPPDHLEKVRSAIFEAGGGVIGKYSGCSFNLQGTGTYLPEEGTRPYSGRVGRREETDEVRVEVVAPRDRVEGIIRKTREVHPYEEPAYDVYPLMNPTHRGGMGRIGRLPEPMAMKSFAEKVRGRLGLNRIKVAGDPEKRIEKVAVCGGSGGSLLGHAFRHQADAFISGEFGYHQALDAVAQGLTLIDTGHFPSEKPVLEEVKRRLESRFSGNDGNLAVQVFHEEKDVFYFA